MIIQSVAFIKSESEVEFYLNRLYIVFSNNTINSKVCFSVHICVCSVEHPYADMTYMVDRALRISC